MKFVRRILGWSLFLGFLWAVAFGVFHFIRHRPRFVLEGPANHLHLSADGSRLAVLEWTQPKGGRGPWRVWDTRRGRVVHELFGDAAMRHFEVSPDRRHLAVMLSDDDLRLVDWVTGEEQQLPVGRLRHFEFSPQGKWLFVGGSQEEDNVAAPGPFPGLSDRQFVFRVADKQLALQLEETFFHSGDERFLFGRKWGDRGTTTIWDLNSGKKVASLPIEGTDIVVAADRRSLVASHTGQRGIEIWDLASSELRFAREGERGDVAWKCSPDGKLLSLTNESTAGKIEMIEVASGRTLWSEATTAGYVCRFSRNGSLCSHICDVPHRDRRVLVLTRSTQVFTMFDAGSGRVLWVRPCAHAQHFPADGPVLLQETLDAPLEFLDARTGRRLATAPINIASGRVAPEITPDGRHVLLHGHQWRQREPYFWEAWLEKRWPDVFGHSIPAVSVMETATGRELFRVLRHGWQSRMLSDDGSTLVTVDALSDEGRDGFATRIWDVSPTRAYLWAIGVAAGTGIALLFLRRVRRKLKARAASTKQAPSPSAAA
jgi:WD40 repeat protein